MSTQLSVVLHRIPSYFPRNGSAEERERDAYRAIIDRTTPGWLASALAVDRTFDVTPFGIDDDAFHNHDFIPLAAFVDCPQAIAAGRDHLYAVVDSYAISHCSHRADVWIGSMWVAIYGGQSCCDEPFDGYSSVSALALLPELGMLPAPKTPASLHGEVRKAVQDGMDPVVMEWESENSRLIDRMVAEEIGERETEVADAVESVLSGIRTDIRDAVVHRIGEVMVFLSQHKSAAECGRSPVTGNVADDRYVPAAVVRRIDRLTARLLRLEGEGDRYARGLHADTQFCNETVEKTGAAEGVYRRQVNAEIDRVSYHLAYWQGVRAQQLADGTTMAYDFDVVRKGDQIFYAERWSTVVRVNAKSVSVAPIIKGNLTDRVAYFEIEGLRTAEGNLVRIVEGARVIDPAPDSGSATLSSPA